MKELLKEWRRYINEEEGVADLPSQGDYSTVPKEYTYENPLDFDNTKGKILNDQLRVYPSLVDKKLDTIDLANFMLKHKDYINVKLGDNREQNFNMLLKELNRLVIKPIMDSLNEAKKISYSLHTNSQSMKAYENFLTKKKKTNLLSSIPTIIQKILGNIEISLILTEESSEGKAITTGRNISFNAYAILEYSEPEKKSKILSILVHELSHIIDHYIGGYIKHGDYNVRDNDNPRISKELINQNEFMKNFFKPSFFTSDAEMVYLKNYLLKPHELYPRLKKLQFMINPKTGSVDVASLKAFIKNPKLGDNEDVEDLFKVLDFSTEEKIQKFVNLLNTIAKADVSKPTMVA